MCWQIRAGTKRCDIAKFYLGSELTFTLSAPRGKEEADGNQIISRGKKDTSF